METETNTNGLTAAGASNGIATLEQNTVVAATKNAGDFIDYLDENDGRTNTRVDEGEDGVVEREAKREGEADVEEDDEELEEEEGEEEKGEVEYLESEMPSYDECESTGVITGDVDKLTPSDPNINTDNNATIDNKVDTKELNKEDVKLTTSDANEATLTPTSKTTQPLPPQPPKTPPTSINEPKSKNPPTPDTQSKTEVVAKKEQEQEPVDEHQCRVCTSKTNLQSLFKKFEKTTPADMLVLICPNISIAPKDFMPQFICSICFANVTIAIQLKNQLETTDRDLRKRLSRSKNKVRRPRGYVVIDAPVSESGSDDEELNDDAEFKVSDVAGSSSVDSDSADSDISEKRGKRVGRGRRGRKPKAIKRNAGSISGSNDDDGGAGTGAGAQKKKCLTPPVGQGPFECNQCDLTFARKQSYVLHRRVHDNTNDIRCEICKKKFKLRRAYQTHMERHDAERAQFACDQCDETFRQRSELKRHIATHHDEQVMIFECKRCRQNFPTHARLVRHQNTTCPRLLETKPKRPQVEPVVQGRDLFKSVAPLTTTYWSDSFSD